MQLSQILEHEVFPPILAARPSVHVARPYGSVLLSAEAREMMRQSHDPNPQRWLADYLIRGTGGVILGDAKFRYPRQPGYSIEMRSYLHATMETHDTWYLVATCTDPDLAEFTEFGAIKYNQLVRTKWCCYHCRDIFTGELPMTAFKLLPERCCCHDPYLSKGSGTPWFAFSPEGVTPL
jgi:hypothetical protein